MRDSFVLAELAERVGGRVLGDPQRRCRGVAPLDQAGPEELSFLTSPRHRKSAANSRAGAILVGPGIYIPGHDLLEVPDPKLALAEILSLFQPPSQRRPGISPDARVGQRVRLGGEVEIAAFAVIGDDAQIGDRCVIGAACVIGAGSSVGDDTVLHPRVVLYPGSRVGQRCLLHSGVVLGADGFGFVNVGGKHRKIPQLGHVVVEDDVEIGANSTVDRASLGRTLIGCGSKIDNLVLVAHGVRIGPDSLLVGQSGIAGSARLGARVTLAGQSGVADHVTIDDDAVIAAKTAVFSDLPKGAFVAGTPALDHRAWKRSRVLLKKLPELRAEVRSLKERVAELEDRLARRADRKRS